MYVRIELYTGCCTEKKATSVYSALLCQEVSVWNSAHRKPSVTPVGGAASLATAHARHATGLIRQTVIFVLVEMLHYMGNVLWLTVPWDSTMTVRGTDLIFKC